MLRKIIGAALVLLGVAALYFGGITYTKESHDTRLGPIELGYAEKGRIEIPRWLGAGAALVGLALLLLPRLG